MSEENQNLEPENNTIPDEQSAVDVEDTSNQGEEGKPTEERLYAGKYKSVEELEKGYENLQKKFYSGLKEEPKPVEEKPKDNTPKELNYEDSSLENVQHIAKELDVDWDKITAEFYDNDGQLSDESYQDLISKGIPKSFIDKASVGLKAQADKEIEMIAELCGGKEEYFATMEWAAINLDENEREALQQDLRNKPSLTTGKAIVSYLHNKRLEAEGVTPKYITGSASGLKGDYFETLAQVTAAMSDPRYKSGTQSYDPAYVKAVGEKLERSRKAGKKLF